MAAAMLFSVLLPTHDRLEYLRYAVESVRRQDEADWELIVSDNDSTDDIAGFVQSLGDERVRYVRTDQLRPGDRELEQRPAPQPRRLRRHAGRRRRAAAGLPVRAAGADRALRAPRRDLHRRLPLRLSGVLPDAPAGWLQPNLHAPFFTGATEPFLLSRAQARELAQAATDFRALYDFNMQYVLVSRPAIEHLSGDGDFFRSPFPDYYAMNLLFAEAERIAVDPRPRVVIGITKRSYGFFHFNRREKDARALLATDGVDPEIRRDLAQIVLPGTNINTSWLLAVEALYRRLDRVADMRPNYARYRRLQALYCEQARHLHRMISRSELRQAEAGLAPAERALLRVFGPMLGALVRVAPRPVRRAGAAAFGRVVGQYGRAKQPEREIGRYRDIIEVLDRFEPAPRSPSPSPSPSR